jgi:hypothetical protein
MGRKKIVNYVKSNSRPTGKHLPEYNFGSFQVFIQDPLPEHVDIKKIFSEIENVIPEHLLELLDVIYIGDFSFLRERDINAMYADGAIYILNEQDDNDDLKDDVVHELSHAVDEQYGDFLYAEGLLEDEFLLKRNKLRRILSHQGYDISKYDFYNPDYDQEFDEFLYSEIGYDVLRIMTVDIFTGAYAATSLREYVARCFEEYYLGNRVYLQDICPYVYKKLSALEKMSPEDEYAN